MISRVRFAVIYVWPPPLVYILDRCLNPASHCRRRRFDGNPRINLCDYAQIRPSAFGGAWRLRHGRRVRLLGDVNGLGAVLALSLCALVNPRIATRLTHSLIHSRSLPPSAYEAIKAARARGKTSR